MHNHFRPKSCGAFSRVLMQNLQISQGYIFRILQHFADKLCNFTNSKFYKHTLSSCGDGFCMFLILPRSKGGIIY